MRKFKVLVSLTLFLAISVNGFSQKNFRDSCENVMTVAFGYGNFFSNGDFADRFGNTHTLEFAARYKLSNNFTLGVQSNFLFSENVKENNILNSLLTENAEVLDENGNAAAIILMQRGYHIHMEVGKIFSLKKFNPNTGIWVRAGAGFLQHKIRIEHQNHKIPFLEDDYLKGYDRLTNGLSLYQSIGFINFSNSKLANFSIAFEAYEAFTQNRRELNFDTGEKDDKKRLDIMLGVKVNWILPLYKRMAYKYYFD